MLRGERVLLRPARPDDVGPLTRILAQPEVERWWGRHDADRVRAEIAGAPGTLAVEAGGRVIGAILVHEETDPDYRHAGLDIFLSAAHHGRGLGREALRLAAGHLMEGRGHHRLTIDPRADNEAAIRCYAAVGFRPVGVMRRYERGDDGAWHDGLLMELVDERRA